MIWVGTSGYQFPEWRGSFYPPKFPTEQMLDYYTQRFPTVEINYTFYRTPSEQTMRGWYQSTPTPFKLTVKAPRRITHFPPLLGPRALVYEFQRLASLLDDKLGVLLFQIPDFLERDLTLLDGLLSGLQPGTRTTLDFRHLSWHDEAVYARLRAANIAMCITDSLELQTPRVLTADYAYVRLRGEGYTLDSLQIWADQLREWQSVCRDVFVYFRHEATGSGPALAQQLQGLLAG